jgi:hypothetical protein
MAMEVRRVCRHLTPGSFGANPVFYVTDAEEGLVRGLSAITYATYECGSFRTLTKPFPFVGLHAAIAVLVARFVGSTALGREAQLA